VNIGVKLQTSNTDLQVSSYWGSLILDPEDIKSISLGVIWNFSKVTGLP